MDSLTPFMLEAKREYLSRLANEITPFVMRDVQRMHDAAEAADKPLQAFQTTLRSVPTWNAAVVRDKTASIETKCPCLTKLIAAVFVSYIKVMSSVRVSGDERPNLRLKLPTNDAFIHRVYVETARAFYEDPALIRKGSTAKREAIFVAIETTVRDLLPIGEILSVYLGDTVNDGSMPTVLSPVHSDDECGNDDDAPAAVESDDDDDDASLDIPDKAAEDDDDPDDSVPDPATPFPQAPPPPPGGPAPPGPAPQQFGMPPVAPGSSPFAAPPPGFRTVVPTVATQPPVPPAGSPPRPALFDDAIPDPNFK